MAGRAGRVHTHGLFVAVNVCLVSGVPPAPGALMAGLGEGLARFKLPKKIVLVGELPRDTMGKVQKNLLRDTYAALLI